MNYKLLYGWLGGMLPVLFGGKDNAAYDFKQFFRIKLERFKFRLIQEAGFMEKIKPIAGFITFFLGDRHFVNEVGSAFGIYCFPDVCTDRSAGTEQLFTHNKFSPFGQEGIQIYNPYSKPETLFAYNVFPYHSKAKID